MDTPPFFALSGVRSYIRDNPYLQRVSHPQRFAKLCRASQVDTTGDSSLKLAKYVKFRDEKFGGVLFETRTEKVFTLNPAAAAIVREIEAGSEEQQIVVRLKGRFRDPQGALEQESASFIAELRRRGLVESS